MNTQMEHLYSAGAWSAWSHSVNTVFMYSWTSEYMCPLVYTYTAVLSHLRPRKNAAGTQKAHDSLLDDMIEQWR